MKDIIHYIADELVEKVLENFKNTNMHLNDLCELLLADCKEAACKLTEAYAQACNLQLRQDKAGRRNRLSIREKNRERIVLTEIGTLHIPRDYYYDKKTKQYLYPLDLMLGLEKYERVLASVKAKLVETAASVSYAKSAQLVTGGAVSRQTVRNQILHIQLPQLPAEGEKRRCEELHIFADEDHVHLQKPGKEKGKKHQIVPLITVTEGIDTNKKRHHTKEAKSFVDEDFDTKRLWQTVSGYLSKRYDLESLEHIYIHGDGGSWIQNGPEEYAQTEHVIDGFHFERELKRISGYYKKKQVRQKIGYLLTKKERKDLAEKYLQELAESAEDEKIKEKTEQFGTYLKNHWEAIKKRRKKDMPGSCTEGQVSHLLSKRFSRDPMGWSKVGLGKLSAARIHLKNGEKLGAENFQEKKESWTYSAYAEQLMQEVLHKTYDWSITEERTPMIYDLASGTQQVLRQIGTYRNLWN